ncbi:BBE-domain-containing protein [Hypoxylon sp. NC1633]|nr:BBE-domain-containing protein [Hypoxylon sp. NC1633]
MAALSDEYGRLIDKCIQNPDLSSPLKRRVLAEKSTHFLYETLVAQWLKVTERAYPTNKTYELSSSFIFKNDNKAAIVSFLVTWIPSGGKAAKKDPTETAFFWRETIFHAYVTVEWVDKCMERDMRLFLAEVKKGPIPLPLNEEAAFINLPDRDFATKFHERAYFGRNRDELRRVKAIWDPDNFFKWTQGVRRPGDPDENAEDVDDEDKTDQLASQQWAYYKTEDLEEDLNYLADLGNGEGD